MWANISEHLTVQTAKARPQHRELHALLFCDKRAGSFTSPANHFNTEDAGDGAYGLQSLSEKTWKSNHLLM